VKLCAVVKADGYGHGAAAVARQAVAAGADYLAVAILDEALRLRRHGFQEPILILGYTPAAQARLVAGHALTQTVFDLDDAHALSQAASAAGKTVKVHLKIETGMGRLGVRPEDAPEFAMAVAKLPFLELEGLFTHFAMADSRDTQYTRRQFHTFMAAKNAVASRGLTIPISHCANSAAILTAPEMQLDMVRAGIIIYGLWPSSEIIGPVIDPRPAMKLKAGIAMIKSVPAGTSLSYGGAFKTVRPSRIATLPVGYADGWTRMLSGRAEVLVEGRRAPVVGRICMDQCLVDITDLPEHINRSSEVLLFGGPELPVESVASKLKTINYEIVCMVGKRVPRLYK
jgi:alanine racemase